MKILFGVDEREAPGVHVFIESVLKTSPGAELQALPAAQRDGSNAFTYARFLVPFLCGHEGWALAVDGADMLVRADLQELFALRDESKAVMVVKHDYKTRHPRKYVGTPMEADNRDYPRKNWSSVILWNCGHPANREIDVAQSGDYLHGLRWLDDDLIGELPREWNWLVDEYGENESAKLLHWTAGIPGFSRYWDAPMARIWHDMRGSFA